jgi:protein CpxP
MKKNALMILLAGLVSFGAMAQDKKDGRKRGGEKPTPEKVAEWKTNRVKETVGLNDDQYKKLYAVHLDEAKKNEAIRAERSKAIKAERDAYKSKLEGILSPDQLNKLSEKKPQRSRGDYRKKGDSKGRK